MSSTSEWIGLCGSALQALGRAHQHRAGNSLNVLALEYTEHVFVVRDIVVTLRPNAGALRGGDHAGIREQGPAAVSLCVFKRARLKTHTDRPRLDATTTAAAGFRFRVCGALIAGRTSRVDLTHPP